MGSPSGQFKMALNSGRLVTSIINPPGGRGVKDCVKTKLGQSRTPIPSGGLVILVTRRPGCPLGDPNGFEPPF